MMLKALDLEKKATLPNQTRLMAEFMLNSYKQRIVTSFEDDCEHKFPHIAQQPDNKTFMSDRFITLLKNKLRDKTALVKDLENELEAAHHVIRAEEHIRTKFEIENKKLRQEKDIYAISRSEETTMLTLALHKYRDEKDRYCNQLQAANKQITSLEFDLQDKKNRLQTVCHELRTVKERLTREALLRQNRDAYINAQEKDKSILLQARKEETIAVQGLIRQHKRDVSALKAINSESKQKMHYLQLEMDGKEKTIHELVQDKLRTNAVRQEESEALLYFLDKYKAMQAQQQEQILEMKSDMYQEGIKAGSLVQNY